RAGHRTAVGIEAGRGDDQRARLPAEPGRRRDFAGAVPDLPGARRQPRRPPHVHGDRPHQERLRGDQPGRQAASRGPAAGPGLVTTDTAPPGGRSMIEPYQAIGLVPTMRGIRHRDEISVNIEHISHLIKAASWLSSLDLPVRLIAIPEGALQGFNDEVLDLDHETFARECAIDVPGPETDALGALARQWNAFVMGQAKARHPEFPGRFFNIGFVLSPDGEVILRHHKVVPLLPVEHSVTPHNVWDKWIELYGRNLDAFYPVADTEIGRLGFLMANEGSYPENARGLAMNGAEVVYRGPYPHPHVGNGLFEVQN